MLPAAAPHQARTSLPASRVRPARVLFAACVALASWSCSESTPPTDPGDDNTEIPTTLPPGLRAVAGNLAIDTIDAEPVQALVVELIGPDRKPATGSVIRFTIVPSD